MPTTLAAVGPWWSFVVRGVAAIVFGILAILFPKMAVVTLVLLFGAYALVEGGFNLASAFQREIGAGPPRWVLAAEGAVSIGAGILAFVFPGLTALSLLFLVAGWSIVTGVLELAEAISLRREIRGEWRLALSGVLSIGFGVVLLAWPGAGALAVVLWIGAYAVMFGALLIALGVKLRSWTRSGKAAPPFGRLAPQGR